MNNKKVYISGPITCNKEHYKEEFEKAKKFLESKGYSVINPAEDDYTEEVKKAGIIEGNYWHDTYWGVCEGVGENHLGKLLMEIRNA